MSFKLLLLQIKFCAVLLLFSSFSKANAIAIVKEGARTELKSNFSFHKESLQQETYQLGVKFERTSVVKMFQNLGFFTSDFIESSFFRIENLFLDIQDVNRCQSVSIFLFPYHFFW